MIFDPDVVATVILAGVVAHKLASALVPEPRPQFPPPLFPPPDGKLLAGECPRCETAFVTREIEGRTTPWVVICDNPKCCVEIRIE